MAKRATKRQSEQHPKLRPGPEGGTRATNREQMRETLRGKALALFLSDGVESVTIDQIVGAAKVAKGSFYRYFSDKSDLVENLIDPTRKAMREALLLAESDLDAART